MKPSILKVNKNEVDKVKIFSGKPDFTIAKGGFSQMDTVMVGGIQQTILIQTQNIKNPILFFLHGGPSMPIPGVSNRGKDYALFTNTKQLVNQYTLVYWDQRGTGKSYSKEIPKETMNLNQFIQDANEIIDILLERFNQQKVHLIAHSWGTIIGLSLINQYPEKFHSYTGFSQVTNWIENEKLCYRWVMEKAREANDQKAIKDLTNVGEPPFEQAATWTVIRKWLLKYKSMVYETGDKKAPTLFKSTNVMLKSPDYTFLDVYNSMVRGFKLAYTEQMVQDFNNVNFFLQIPIVNVPVLFIHGRKEKHIMPEFIQSYFDQLEAPQKKLHWAEKSSHVFHPEDAEENEQVLLKQLRGIPVS
ncbi:alpha/beta fold hydrolase [Neobacillus sp. Marseille-QA0830]